MFDYEDELQFYRGYSAVNNNKDPMDSIDIGDIVSIAIKDGVVTFNYQMYDEKFSGLIIGKNSVYEDLYEYIVYIPDYQKPLLKESKLIRGDIIKNYNVNKKFLNDSYITIRKNNVINIISKLDGVSCKKCGEFNQKSEANQEDGSFVCYQCRFNKYR